MPSPRWRSRWGSRRARPERAKPLSAKPRLASPPGGAITFTVNAASTPATTRPPRVLVFDSGLGGLTVHAEIRRLRPDAQFTYAADDAVFPYGGLPERQVVARVLELMRGYIAEHAPDTVVIACNTASTLVLPHLRAAFPALPFIGTVPAIKPAAEHSRSRLISVLATPGTVARDYTRALVDSYAAHCRVTLVGSTRLATMAEDFMQGGALDEADVALEIAPCFVENEGARTDTIVLACTHYPLLGGLFARLAPWGVTWIDPAPAIARRVDHVLGEAGFPAPIPLRSDAPAPGRTLFTSGRVPNPALAAALRARGLES